MNTLIVYGTNSSGTMQAAELVRDILTTYRHKVTLKRANQISPEAFKQHDLIVLGSCSWERFDGQTRLEGQLQEHMFELAEKLRVAELPVKQYAVFGLGDSSYTTFCGAVDHLEQLVADLHGHQVGTSLRIDGYFFHPESNHQKITDWTKELIKKIR